MILTIDLWQAISLLITIVGAFWGIGKMLAAQSERRREDQYAHITKQLEQLNRRTEEQDESDRRLERQMGDMRAELPREYVRRDDFVRAISGFDVRVDQLRLTIERALYEREKN